MSRKKNLRRLNVLVTAQTLYNLDRLSKMEGDRNIGRAIDKLTREKMMRLNPHRCAKCGRLKQTHKEDIPKLSNEPLTQADLNKMYLNEVWLECPDGSGETALVVLGKLYNTSSLEGAGLDLEEYVMGETLNNPTGTYKVYRHPPEGEEEKT